MLKGSKGLAATTKDTLNWDEAGNVIGYKVVTERDAEEAGKIKDYAFDTQDRLRYLVVDTGPWIFGKKIPIPVGLCDIDDSRHEVVIRNITKEQLEQLPDYGGGDEVTDDYEYTYLQAFIPQDMTRRGETTEGIDYESYPEFRASSRLQLLEEHLRVSKHQEKAGEVTIRKHVETQKETVEIPVSRETLIIETHPAATDNVIVEGQAMGQNEVTIPLYEEKVDVTKPVEAREVSIRKETEIRTERIEEQVQHEELDVEPTGDVQVRRENI